LIRAKPQAAGFLAAALRGITAACLASLALSLAACEGTPASPPPQTVESTATAEPATSFAQVTDTALPPPTDTPIPPSPTADASATAQAEAERTRTRYKIEADFDFSRHALSAAQTITYTNRLDEPLDDLLLAVDPNLIPGVFELKSLAWEDGVPADGFTLEKTNLSLPLQAPLMPGEQITLSLEWAIALPERSGELGYNELQANLVDWYPYIPPYREGSGWVIDEAWPFGEYLTYESSDFDVRIRLTGGVRPVIAAGAVGREDGEWTAYKLEAARAFAWSASPHYQVTTRQAGDVSVSAYTYPGHQPATEAALDEAVKALELFTSLYGPYPQPVLTLVEASFPDGMEFDGLIFISQGYIAEFDGTPQNFMTILTVHETAHQWWFGVVGNGQAQEPWLDEAIATYSELIFYENYYPDLVEWWWFFRVNYFGPQGWIDGSIYDFSRFQEYFSSVYHRGAQFHRDLRASMGDEAYFGFLSEYLSLYRQKVAWSEDFMSLLRDKSPVDLEPLLQEYFSPQ
jgi:hypothetical protein